MLKLILCSFLVLSNVWAHEYLTTDTLKSVEAKASELRTKFASKEILIVFDIDNTLLKAKQSLGSDQWFEWQAAAIANATSEARFKNIDELLAAQANFFQLSTMALTEQNLPTIVGNLKASGHHIILLTSRSPSLRNVTERELTRNKLAFGDRSIMQGIPFEFSEAPFKHQVSFMNGIFMTSGHHKGEALAYILSKAAKKANKNFKAIIFADDHERHTKRVYDTFSTSAETEIITYRYSKEDATVAAFKAAGKDQVNAQTGELLRLQNKIFKK